MWILVPFGEKIAFWSRVSLWQKLAYLFTEKTFYGTFVALQALAPWLRLWECNDFSQSYIYSKRCFSFICAESQNCRLLNWLEFILWESFRIFNPKLSFGEIFCLGVMGNAELRISSCWLWLCVDIVQRYMNEKTCKQESNPYSRTSKLGVLRNHSQMRKYVDNTSERTCLHQLRWLLHLSLINVGRACGLHGLCLRQIENVKTREKNYDSQQLHINEETTPPNGFWWKLACLLKLPNL